MSLFMNGAVLFHGAMLIVALTAAWAAHRNGRPRAWVLALAAIGSFSLLLAFNLGDGGFGSLRLLAYGSFGYLPVILATAAISLARRQRRACVVFAAILALVEAVAIDAFLVEPHWLEVKRVRLVSPKIHTPMTIAIVADLQTDDIGPYEQSVLERLMATRPDLILLAGDYIQEFDDADRRRLHRELRAALQEIDFRAPLGAYAVRGNVDSDGWRVSFENTNVTCINDTRTFDVGELSLTALALDDSFSPHLKIGKSERFHIVFGHCPNFALGEIEADLLIAGHTHGGQVRLPLIGPLVTRSRVPRGWAAGVSQLGEGKTLIVSRGIGMERGHAPTLRFLCRPELILVELLPESNQ